MDDKQKRWLRHGKAWIEDFRLDLVLFALLMIGAAFGIRSCADRLAPAEEPVTEPTEPVFTYDQTKFQEQKMEPQAMAQGDLVLVNIDHGFDAESVTDLQTVYSGKTDSYYVRDASLAVRPYVLSNLNRWLDDFVQETGVTNVNVVAGHRTQAYQQDLYDNAVANRGLEHAERYIAHPGYSEHHTGLAIDFDTYYADSGASGDFDGSGTYRWIGENAWTYGFVQRYPDNKVAYTGIDFEPWHFRYVGLPHSYQMRQNDMCLEEYIDYLKDYPFDGPHLNVTCLDRTYEIYYCAGDTVYLPKQDNYSISGNNVDGYIITVG